MRGSPQIQRKYQTNEKIWQIQGKQLDEGVTVDTGEPDEGVTVDTTEAGKDLVDTGGCGGIRVIGDSGGINTAGDFRTLFFGVVVFPVELPMRLIKLLSSPPSSETAVTRIGTIASSGGVPAVLDPRVIALRSCSRAHLSRFPLILLLLTRSPPAFVQRRYGSLTWALDIVALLQFS